VQIDTGEEHGFYRRNVYEVSTFGKAPAVSEEELETFLAEHGMQSHLRDTRMTVTFPAAAVPDGGEVVDLHTGTALPLTAAGAGRVQVTVATRRFGGALLALRSPVSPELHAPATVARGDEAELRVSLSGMGAAAPVRVSLTDAAGNADREISGCYAVGADGTLRLAFSPAENVPTGSWRLEVEELGSGRRASRAITVE